MAQGKKNTEAAAEATVPQENHDTNPDKDIGGLNPEKVSDVPPQEESQESGKGTNGENGEKVPEDKTQESELEALRREVAELRKLRTAPVEDVVELTFISPVSPDNVCSLGEYGSLNGVGGYIEIPRKEFGGKFLTPVVRSLLQDRQLIVCNGLTPEERRRYGVDYRAGELLDMDAFDRLLDMNLKTLTTLFGKLCPEHKQFTATRFITAYEKGDNRISREKVEALNDLSKAVEPRGLFKPILEGMNKI